MMVLHDLERPPKAILFDMDGVLVDSEALHWRSVLHVLRRYLGHETPALDQRVGWGDHQLWQEMIDTYGLSGTPNSLTQERGEVALQLLKDQPPSLISGAYEAISTWKQADPTLILAVVSASPRQQMSQSLLQYVDHQGASLFWAIFSGIEDAVQNKPSPEPYLAAMKHFELDPSDCWIAEDSTTGLYAGLASAARVFPVGAHFADHEVIAQCEQPLTDLMALLQRWRKLV
jgi:beta-phosphoglucomutase